MRKMNLQHRRMLYNMGGVTNSEFTLLRLANGSAMGVTAAEAFNAMYATSKQPVKKTTGIFRKLQRLARQGLLSERGGSSAFTLTEVRFAITDAGRAAGRGHEAYERGLRQPKPRMRLVK